MLFCRTGLTPSGGLRLTEVVVDPDSTQDHFDYQISSVSQERWRTLRELNEVRTEAEEEGYPIPSPEVVRSAEYLLRKLLPFCLPPFDVYPTPDGEVALDISSEQGSVILLCEPAGTVLCLVNMGGTKQWKRYSSADNREAINHICDIIVNIG